LAEETGWEGRWAGGIANSYFISGSNWGGFCEVKGTEASVLGLLVPLFTDLWSSVIMIGGDMLDARSSPDGFLREKQILCREILR